MTPPLFPGADDDPAITYRDVTCPHDNDFVYRIYHYGNMVGEIYRHEDLLIPGTHLFLIHLVEDHRGFVRVHDINVLHQTTRRLIDTHQLW